MPKLFGAYLGAVSAIHIPAVRFIPEKKSGDIASIRAKGKIIFNKNTKTQKRYNSQNI